MDIKVLDQMYEGKAKQVFATSDPEIVMVHYKDDATAGDGEKKGPPATARRRAPSATRASSTTSCPTP